MAEMFVDTHCHLHDEQFYSRPQAFELLARAMENGIGRVICISTNLRDAEEAQQFTFMAEGEKADREVDESRLEGAMMDYAPLPNVSWTFGIHPEAATNMVVVKDMVEEAHEAIDEKYRFVYAGKVDANEFTMDENGKLHWMQFRSLLEVLPIGIGEVGLDYHYEGYDREAQIRLFEEMLSIANQYNLPVSFHVREAFEDFFGVVANFPRVRGVVHSFTGGKRVLRRILNETNYYVGVNGLATYTTLPMPPLERMLLETDAPFLTPVPFRGMINEPGFVEIVAEDLADKLEVSLRRIRERTTKNARELFGF